MAYKYVAYSGSGELVKGTLGVASERKAVELLQYAGYRAISLKPHIPFFSSDKLLASLFQVKSSEIILLYRQLALLLESGIDITSSLELLCEQADNRALKKVLGAVVADIRDGGQLSSALVKHPKIFPPMYSRLLSIGEQSGDIDSVLRQMADYMEREAVAGKETKNALTYPVIIFIVSIVVVGILITFVLPSFGKLYTSLGVDLPLSVTILLKTSAVIRDNSLYLLLGLCGLVGSFIIYIKSPRYKYNWDKFILKLPRVGRVRHLSELARCCRTMSLLFRAGLPLTEIMPLVIQGTTKQAISRALSTVHQDMVKGEGLSHPMANNKLFLPMMVQMVRVGEETGNLDVTLLAIARSYETEAEDKLHSLIELIPPAMTLVMGTVIGLISLSLTSAMYSMYGQGF
ncbi:type II secretion system F family protein [Chloroflexota bacterium]